ncbi:MAG TPA: adenylate/guanylate cyclase domain-containing protein [Gaiellaceae bacterium]|nr:adenylate/guanylate cyclase domain-containing protein [Gaiellaceae bacterium]
MDALPAGTVTFLFTDVEGSTRLLSELGERYADVLAEHRQVLRAAFDRNSGVEVDTQGDAFFAAFARASDAVAAASEANAALAAGRVQVRMGIHTGEPIVTEEGYIGIDVHRAARVCAAGHGGQVLLTETTRNLLGELELRDLGEHRLRDLSEPQHLFQLGSAEFPPLKTLDATNLPIAASALLDREQEVRELVSLISNGTRLVTVTGPGGTGKTRLGLQVAAELVGAIADGVFWVPLSELSDADLVVPTVAQTLGSTGEITASIRGREALLLLDNAEHLLAAAESLAELLAVAPRLRLLVTSRAPLRVSGEREYPLEPLPEAHAVMLFVERAQAIGQEVQPDETVAAICRRLDGLPLAVELAAARTKLLDPATLLHRLERALPILTGGPRDAPERQRTLRGAIEWSYELLEDRPRTIFRRLAVFVGGCSLEAAEEVCEADLDLLAALVDLSLLKPVGTGRFLMLETIREYAHEQLDASGEAGELREKHALFYAELAERARVELGGNARALWESRLETELPNIRAALTWAAERRPEVLRRFVRALRIFWNTHGYLREGRTWLERALETGVEGLERAEILGGLGWICQAMGDGEGAAAAAEERLELARAANDAKNLTGALGLQAVLAEERGELERAERLHEECIAISRADGRRPERQAGDYAEFLLRQRRHAEAAELFEDCLSAARQHHDTFLVGRYTADIGALEMMEGRPAEALPRLSEGVRILYGLGERYGTVYCLPLLAEAYAALGDSERGAKLLGAADSQLEVTGLALWAEGARRRELTVAVLRDALGQERYAELWAEGAAMSFDEAVDCGLAD